MSEIIWINGELVSSGDEKTCAYTPAMRLGYGLFETMRSYKGMIVYFSAHLERLLLSSHRVGIKSRYNKAELRQLIQKAVKRSKENDCCVRLTLWQASGGADTEITVKKYTAHPAYIYKRGFKATVCSCLETAGPLGMSVKSTSRMPYEYAYQQARKKGYDEALVLNSRGCISEGTRTNVFFLKDKTLFTPALINGCLKGITRMAILDLAASCRIPTDEGVFTLNDIYEADEAFLTNSLIGVMPLSVLEARRIGKGIPGKYTRIFMKKYNSFFAR